jgi:hypothetical protein
MKRILSSTLALIMACAGADTNGPNVKPDGGGAGGGNGQSGAFNVSVLDANAKAPTYFAVAADAKAQRLGIVYYSARGTETNAGVPDYDLKYLEWKQGQVSAPETIRFVQRFVGVSAAFQANGEPVVAHLGGAQSFVPGQSIFWFQDDAALSTRAGGQWTETAVARNGDEAACGNPVSDRGNLVGLWPSVLNDGTGKLYLAWRDGHDGQFPQQDWGGSDVELAEGNVGAFSIRCVNAGGNNKQAWGGRIQMTMSNTGPAMVYDQAFGGADTIGNNVIFQKRNADGNWSGGVTVMNISNTQTGASVAWDSKEGFGVAAVERASSELKYVSSKNGTTWSAVDPVFGSGSGGWYPSLAFDPVNHEPAIAFYLCSPRANVNEGQCKPDEDELRVTQRIDGTWRQVLVDAEGGYAPKIGFFDNGKRWVVYRNPASGVLKVAVEP